MCFRNIEFDTTGKRTLSYCVIFPLVTEKSLYAPGPFPPFSCQVLHEPFRTPFEWHLAS